MAEERCCVCGRALPNRYAVAGRCEEDGCEAAFCALHWKTRVRKCPAHGGGGPLPVAPAPAPAAEPEPIPAPVAADLSPEAKTSILRHVSDFALAIGKGAAALIDRLRGVQDPAAALADLDRQLAANRAHREPLQRRYEQLADMMAEKENVARAAPPARKKILELELQTLLAEYQGLERQLAVSFENERLITVVRARTLELTERGRRRFHEKDLDDLTSAIEGADHEQAGVASALGDLEKAGRPNPAARVEN